MYGLHVQQLTSQSVRNSYVERNVLPSADAFLRLHETSCAGEVSRPRALSCCPRVSSDNSMHHIGRKVRSLELDMEVAATFDFTPMSFLQHGITSSWHATTPPVLEFQGFKFPFFLPSAFGTSFLTSLWLLGESLHKARFCLRS